MSRTPVILDWEQIDQYLMARCSANTIAKMMGIAVSTITTKCLAEKGIPFDEYKRSLQHVGVDMIKSKQFELAMQGSEKMLIHWGKNYCDQKERVDITTNNKDICDNSPRELVITWDKPKEEISG
jgi:hypothetical protein